MLAKILNNKANLSDLQKTPTAAKSESPAKKFCKKKKPQHKKCQSQLENKNLYYAKHQKNSDLLEFMPTGGGDEDLVEIVATKKLQRSPTTLQQSCSSLVQKRVELGHSVLSQRGADRPDSLRQSISSKQTVVKRLSIQIGAHTHRSSRQMKTK